MDVKHLLNSRVVLLTRRLMLHSLGSGSQFLFYYGMYDTRYHKNLNTGNDINLQ